MKSLLAMHLSSLENYAASAKDAMGSRAVKMLTREWLIFCEQPLHARFCGKHESGGIDMDSTTELPRKTRELQNHHMDSTVWNDFQFRDDDVIVATYGKSGTTWTQQIVGQILL